MGLPGLFDITIYARQLLRPRWNLYILTKTNIYYCLLLTQWHQLPFLHITRLNLFTLSHSGSHIPWFTLKPNITVLAPKPRYQLVVNPLLDGLSTHFISNIYRDALCVCVQPQGLQVSCCFFPFFFCFSSLIYTICRFTLSIYILLIIHIHFALYNYLTPTFYSFN